MILKYVNLTILNFQRVYSSTQRKKGNKTKPEGDDVEGVAGLPLPQLPLLLVGHPCPAVCASPGSLAIG